MTHLKSYTSLEQSKVLAKILPAESADMVFVYSIDFEGDEHYDIALRNNQPLFEDDVCAWTLAALLGVLPTFTIDSSDDHYFRIHCYKLYSEWHNNIVDAGYEMVLKLHEMGCKKWQRK